MMRAKALIRPKRKTVNRSQLRQNQSATLRLASGNKAVLISAHHQEDEKILLDRKYFDEMLERISSLMETLEIMNDQKLLNQILASDKSLEHDTRHGKLHSFEEAFG